MAGEGPHHETASMCRSRKCGRRKGYLAPPCISVLRARPRPKLKCRKTQIQRRQTSVATVALANKTARIAWAIMTKLTPREFKMDNAAPAHNSQLPEKCRFHDNELSRAVVGDTRMSTRTRTIQSWLLVSLNADHFSQSKPVDCRRPCLLRQRYRSPQGSPSCYHVINN